MQGGVIKFAEEDGFLLAEKDAGCFYIFFLERRHEVRDEIRRMRPKHYKRRSYKIY